MSDGLELCLVMGNRKAFDECRYEGHKIASLETEVIESPVTKNVIRRFMLLCTSCGLPQKEITADAIKRREKEIKDGDS